MDRSGTRQMVSGHSPLQLSTCTSPAGTSLASLWAHVTTKFPLNLAAVARTHGQARVMAFAKSNRAVTGFPFSWRVKVGVLVQRTSCMAQPANQGLWILEREALSISVDMGLSEGIGLGCCCSCVPLGFPGAALEWQQSSQWKS